MNTLIDKPQAQTDHDIHPLIAQRWSPRAFADQPFNEAVIARLFEAARWTASAFNEQPWRFVYAQKGGHGYDELLSAINPFNQAWASAAPLLIIAVAKNSYSHNGAANAHASYDLGAAVANLTLQATTDDIYIHQMAGFDPARASEALEIPEGYTPVVALAAGYLGDASTLPENLREREHAPRQRKKIETFAFEGRFMADTTEQK